MLAINTAFKESTLALNTKSKKVFRKLDSSCKHSENVLKEIDSMLKEAGENINNLRYIGVVVGPGSFTGIRIGVSLAKAFMCANKDLKAVSISSLEYMARCYALNKHLSKDFYTVIDALSGNFFIAKFNNVGMRIEEDKLISFEDLNSLKGQIIVGLKNENISEESVELSSEVLLQITEDKVFSSEFVDEKKLLPVYLRLSQAESNLKEKNAGKN